MIGLDFIQVVQNFVFKKSWFIKTQKSPIYYITTFFENWCNIWTTWSIFVIFYQKYVKRLYFTIKISIYIQVAQILLHR